MTKEDAELVGLSLVQWPNKDDSDLAERHNSQIESAFQLGFNASQLLTRHLVKNGLGRLTACSADEALAWALIVIDAQSVSLLIKYLAEHVEEQSPVIDISEEVVAVAEGK